MRCATSALLLTSPTRRVRNGYLPEGLGTSPRSLPTHSSLETQDVGMYRCRSYVQFAVGSIDFFGVSLRPLRIYECEKRKYGNLCLRMYAYTTIWHPKHTKGGMLNSLNPFSLKRKQLASKHVSLSERRPHPRSRGLSLRHFHSKYASLRETTVAAVSMRSVTDVATWCFLPLFNARPSKSELNSKPGIPLERDLSSRYMPERHI